MTEIEAIKERHSVRSYLDKKIEPEKAQLLKNMIEECNREGNLHLQFLADAGKTFNRLVNRVAGLGSAPSVIACVGPADNTLEERIGYGADQGRQHKSRTPSQVAVYSGEAPEWFRYGVHLALLAPTAINQ